MKLIAQTYDLRGHLVETGAAHLDRLPLTTGQREHLAMGLCVTIISTRGRIDYQPAEQGDAR